MVLRQSRCISTYPTVVNAAKMWGRAGHSVDIITWSINDLPQLFRKFFQLPRKGILLQILAIAGLLYKEEYDIVIAYEPIDAELLAPLVKFFKLYYIYHNLELRYPSYWKDPMHYWLERTFYDHCQLIISQDELRLKELRCLLGRPCAAMPKIVYVPNTYLQEYVPNNDKYWHSLFSLQNTQKTLLYPGAIQEKKISIEIVRHILKVMPNDWCLILHGQSYNRFAERINEEMKKENNGHKLYLHLQQENEITYRQMIASATAGLVWYTGESDRNEYNLGLSSGKFWRFITLGKRSIIVNRPGLGDYAKENDAGIVIDKIEDLHTEDFVCLESGVNVRPQFFFEYYYTDVIGALCR